MALGEELAKVTTLPADRQAIFLYNCLTSHYRDLCLLDETVLRASTKQLLEELHSCLRSPCLYRANRNVLARCFVVVFRRMGAGPFDPTSRLLPLLKEKDAGVRVATLVVLETIWRHFGREMVSLAGEQVAACSRLLRSSAITVRTAACRTMAAALRTTSADEVIKDAYKAVKGSFPDKSNAVTIAAYECVEVLASSMDIVTLLRHQDAIESSAVRKAAAKCLAARRRVLPDYSIMSMLYNKSMSRRARTMVAMAYEEYIRRADVDDWQAYLMSVLNDLQLGSNRDDPHRALVAQKHVSLLLRPLNRMLNQEGQVAALRRIMQHVRTAPSRYILVSCLEEISALVQLLADATPEDFFEMDALMYLMSHPTPAVHIAAADAVKTICRHVPTLLPTIMTQVQTRLKETDNDGEAEGLALCLGALLTVAVARHSYVTIDALALEVFNLATTTLKSGRRSVGWRLLTAAQSLGPTFIRPQLSQLLLLWKNGQGDEDAIASILAFMKHNRSLMTADVTKRLASLVNTRTASRRTLACLVELFSSGIGTSDDCITIALSTFADPADTKDVSGVLNIWEANDDYCFGMTSLVRPPGDIESYNGCPIVSAAEHDWLHCLVDAMPRESPGEQTQCIDSAIELFRLLYPRQSPQVQASLLSQAQRFIDTSNGSRKTAILLNVILAFQSEVFQEGISSSDAVVRELAGAALAASLRDRGSARTSTQIDELVSRIVDDRDPNVRAGCTTALGHIHASLGGIAASYHLKGILNVLVSLAADPHPTVHYHAIVALHKTIESAGLSFSPHVGPTLALILKLYVGEVLDDWVGNAASTNLACDLPSLHALATCADGLIHILGPDLADNASARELLVKFVGELLVESDMSLVSDGLRCTQHLALFASKQIDMTSYISSLHYYLRSRDDSIRSATIDGLYQLVRADASEVVRHSSISARFDTAIWQLLDRTSEQTVRAIVLAWLRQTLHEYHYWIDFVAQIVIRQRLSDSRREEKPTETEDEGASLGQGDDSRPNSSLRWQTGMFALQCLGELISTLPPENLQTRVADLISIGFTASTSPIPSMRVEGLNVLSLLIARLKHLRDPDFPEQSLLEQYQAQLGSALTPAFAPDSPSEVTSLAIHVCAEFISSGIIQDVERMSRIVRLLNGALERPEARIAALSAFARLQVDSTTQGYLKPILETKLKELIPIWLDCLKEYARLRFEPIDMQSTSLTREDSLAAYDRTWLNLVHAIATVIDSDREFVFDVLGERDSDEIDYRGEPAAFFMVLFGICFESLAHSSMESTQGSIATLAALKSILSPRICGDVVYSEPIFTEMTDLFGRLLLTEGIPTQLLLVETIHSLALHHPHVNEMEQCYVDQMFDLARLTILPLTIVFSWDQTEQGKEPTQLHASLPKLARTCLSDFVDLSERFPGVIKLDLYNALFHVFGNVFQAQQTQATVVPAILPAFKSFCQNVAQSLEDEDGAMLVGPAQYVMRRLIDAREKSTVNNCLLASTILGSAMSTHLPRTLRDGHVHFCVSNLGDESAGRSAEWACKTLFAAHPQAAHAICLELCRTALPSEGLAAKCAITLLFDLLEESDTTVLVPILLAFAKDRDVNDHEVALLTGRLVEHVPGHADMFRSYVQSMPDDRRTRLQALMKAAGESGARNGHSEGAAPQISLKMDF